MVSKPENEQTPSQQTPSQQTPTQEPGTPTGELAEDELKQVAGGAGTIMEHVKVKIEL